MDLNDEQKAAIADWVRDGEGLSDIQKRIKAEFDITMTYMDVRFLILDLGVDVKDKEEPLPPVPPASPPAAAPAPATESPYGAEPGAPVGPYADPAPAPADGHGGAMGAMAANVSVEVDRLVQPGALVSGTVTFSDGVSATWSLDQHGRLTLDAGTPDYQPSEADVEAFQLELRSALETKGF